MEFKNQRLITRGVADNVTPFLQPFLRQLIDSMPPPKDYHRVFRLTLEDGIINDSIVDTLCSLLIDISARMWNDYSDRLELLIESKYLMSSRSQKLRLAHTIETMYAKGYDHLCFQVYLWSLTKKLLSKR